MPPTRVLVIGGAGALGRAVCAALARRPLLAAVSADFAASPAARASITFERGLPLPALVAALRAALVGPGAPRLGAVVVVAGAWDGGGAGGADFCAAVERQRAACAEPALAGAALAAGGALADGGALVLTGAAAALRGAPPGMLAYGLAKATTHALAAALAGAGGGLPPRARVLLVAPGVLDTPANRAAMPGADAGAWTPPDAVAAQIAAWCEEAARGEAGALCSGAVVEPVTRGGVTAWELR
jgi:NAD(P)-dependent dehydrogenase (short-subunit alcohol dehydrogenase family)